MVAGEQPLMHQPEFQEWTPAPTGREGCDYTHACYVKTMGRQRQENGWALLTTSLALGSVRDPNAKE